MLGLTKDEKLVIIFLSASLAAGSALLLYKRHHPGFAPGLRTAAGDLPSPLADTLSCAHSDSVLLPGAAAAATPPRAAPMPVGPVNINTAGQKALERLPNIGPSMAKKIIEYRSSAGGFTSVEQLGRVKGIGPKRLEQLRRHVTVDK
jgi:competence protein ComEA